MTASEVGRRDGGERTDPALTGFAPFEGEPCIMRRIGAGDHRFWFGLLTFLLSTWILVEIPWNTLRDPMPDGAWCGDLRRLTEDLPVFGNCAPATAHFRRFVTTSP